MRIHVDARLLRAGGIGRYIREITGPWLREPEVASVRFLGRPEELEPWLDEVDARGIAEVTAWSDPPYSLRAQLRWPGLGNRRAEPDVTFFPHYDAPMVRHPRPSLVTVHDLIQYRLPEGFPGWKRWGGARLLGRAVTNATGIVAVSEATGEDLARRFPGAAAKIRVVRNGVSEVFRPLTPSEKEAARERLGRLSPFCLTLGADKHHKNLGLAVTAVEKAREAWPELQLVMVGLRPGDLQHLRSRCTGASDWLHEAESVSDAELRELYGSCTAFLWPSALEGFGLPLLEASAVGAPVLASDTPVSREVMGREGVTYLPASDPEPWVDALLELRDAPPSAQQGTATRRSWGTASSETLDVARRLAAMGS